jgi:recombination protein RecR
VYAGPVQDLIDELGRLPGVGPKSAQRIAFHILKLSTEDALRIATAIAVMKERVSFCTICFNISEGDACGICSDTRRETSVVCVVE